MSIYADALNQGVNAGARDAISLSKSVFRRVLLLLVCVFLAASAFAQESATNQFNIGPVPAWVTQTPASTPSIAVHPVSQGERYLLLDQQCNAASNASYSHLVREITSQEGVQNGAKLQLDFDPSFQKLTVHFVRIIRNGTIIDALEPQKFKVIQRETELERHLFNGELYAVLFLEGVRVGDLIEYACTITGSNPILKGHFANSFLTEWSAPMEQQTFRLLWPSGKHLNIKNHNTSAEPQIRPLGDLIEYTWNISKTPAVTFEDSVPPWIETFGWVQFSDFSNWREVAEWALPLYGGGHPDLPPELRAKIDYWRRLAKPDKVLQALRFVQDEVRYLGLEIGPNSHQPNEAAVVFTRRFGDCKDKVNLFCAILHELGIEAHPVLVNSYYRQGAKNWIPSPFAFNHVVARVRLDGSELWLDPTLSYQRGALTNLYFPDYDCGLVLAPGTADLTEIPTQQTGAPLTTTYDTFHVISYTNPVAYEVRTIKRGLAADRLRAALAVNSLEDLQKSDLNYYARHYPRIKATLPMEVHDDEENNEISIIQYYQISDMWELSENKSKWLLNLWADGISDLALDPQTSLRTYPLYVLHPVHRRYIMRINFTGPANFKPDLAQLEDKALSFTRKVEFAQKTLTIDYDYKTLTNMISVADAPEHFALLKRIREKAVYNIQRPFATTAIASFQPNWPIYSLTAVYSILLIPAMIMAYVFRPRSKTPPPLNSDPALTGIAGWLVLLALGLLIRPFTVAALLFKDLRVCSLDNWNLLTTPGSDSYNANWVPLLIFEILCNLTCFAFGILAMILFFQKRFAAPRYLIALMVFTVLVMLVDHFWFSSFSTSKIAGPSIMIMVMNITAWTAYLLVSRRVKQTFTR